MNGTPLMPDFACATHAFHHTIDSALAILADLKVPPALLTLHMDGAGYPTRWIVRQHPPPGSPLTAAVTISLVVAGTGYFHALPVGMWDKGSESEPGTEELLEALDDPLQKAAHWIREGARLFDIRPDNLEACSRWISLFGIQAESWPTDLWYRLAILLPNVQHLAGKEYGLRFALNLLLDLPLKEIRRSPAFRRLNGRDLSLLGKSLSRLGVDMIAGDRAEDLAKLTLVLGHSPLSVYYAFQEPAKLLLLQSVLDLMMPFHQSYSVQWIVLDPSQQPQLGNDVHNGLLGINSYLGPLPAKVDGRQESMQYSASFPSGRLM